MREFRLDIGTAWFRLKINETNGSGRIESNLKSEEDEDQLADAAFDGLESLILAHACAGVNVTSSAYRKGIRTALDAIKNKFD